MVVEMDLLTARRLNLSKSCLSSPVPARWPALGKRAYTCRCGMCDVCVVSTGRGGVVVSLQGGDWWESV